jgi:hypothetical protein
MATISQYSSFVEGGDVRAYAAIADAVRREVEVEYAAQLEQASPAGRALLKLKIRREVRRRVRKVLSPTALF